MSAPSGEIRDSFDEEIMEEMEFVHPFNSLIGELVFPYLELRDLLLTSSVCKAWNMMTTDKLLVSNKHFKWIMKNLFVAGLSHLKYFYTG